MGRAGPHRVRRVRRRPAAVGPRAARAGADRAARGRPRRTSTTCTAPPCATVHLAVRDGTEVLYLDRLAGHASVPVVSTRRLAAADARDRRRQGAARPRAGRRAAARCWRDLTRVTPYTITQPGRLRRQLAGCCRDDYATTVEEMSLGACSVAVPIRRGDDVVAALGIVVPRLKRDRARLVGRAAGRRPAASAARLDAASGQRKSAGGPADGRRPGSGTMASACAPRSPSSARAPPACCSPTCSPPTASSRSWSRPARRSTSPSRIRAGILEQSTVDLLARRRASATGCDREGDQHRGIYLQWPQRAAPPRLRRPRRPLGLGLRPDRGAEGPGRGPARRRPAGPLRGQPTPRCTTSRPTGRR